MTDVIFKKAEYPYETLKPALFEMISALDGGQITKSSHVLIKPNLLLAAKPERGILTHPLVVKAVAEYVMTKGAFPQISDSPALGTFEKVLKLGGYRDAFKDLAVNFTPFDTSIKVDIGKPFGRIDIAKNAVQADVVINIAKLKTHTQMLLTLGVKNLFGCIIGGKKPEWHLRCGVRRELFAKLLAQIYLKVNPAITIIDGILGLQGEGPGRSGTPKHMGVLIGSKSAPAADISVCKMLGLDPDKLPTNLAVKQLGIADGSVNILGDFHRISGFRLPVLGSLFLGPKVLHKWMRRHMIQKPAVDATVCMLCGECSQYCPAKAISQYDHGIDFDYDACIRCYCCIEICPHGALRTIEPLPGKVLRKAQNVWENIR